MKTKRRHSDALLSEVGFGGGTSCVLWDVNELIRKSVWQSVSKISVLCETRSVQSTYVSYTGTGRNDICKTALICVKQLCEAIDPL